MAWQPDQGQLKQLVGFLRDSLSGYDQNAQKYATLVSATRALFLSSTTPKALAVEEALMSLL